MSVLKDVVGASRGLARELAERVLTGSGVTALARRCHRDSAVILAYHNILPSEAPPVGDRSLHLPRSMFARQLDLLVQTHRIVSLERLLRPGESDDTDSRPTAVLTFDDAYRGALTAGLEELRRRGLPCTVFVAPGKLGDQSLWWDEAAEAEGGHLDHETRSMLLSEYRGSRARIEPWLEERNADPPHLPPHARTVTESELSEVVSSFELTLGSHTWSHPHLPALARESTDTVEQELVASREWLEERFPGAFRRWLAYPYGAASDRLAATVASAGYGHAVLIDGGLCEPEMLDRRPRALPRFNVPSGLSLRGFRLRTAGLLLT